MMASRICRSRRAIFKCYSFCLAIAFLAVLCILNKSSTDYTGVLSTYQEPLAAKGTFEDRSPLVQFNGLNQYHNESQRSINARSNRRVRQEVFPRRQHFSLIEKAQEEAITRVLTNIDTCMMASNLNSPVLLKVARQNAKLFMEEYGKVVSPHHLDGYVNHCWDTDYYLTLDSPFMKGFIGQTTFKTKIHNDIWYERAMKTFFHKEYSKTYKSSKVCLPNIYLLGFEKSGSTFFWCLLSRIFNRGFIASHKMKISSQIQADKEPYFWTPFNYKPAMPSAERMAGEYIPMFLKASDPSIQERVRKNLTMIDGSPSTVIEWPRFTETEPELANYCLLPSALPELFPQSKYLVIMRNPINMMYSAFWWSLYSATDNITKKISKHVRHDHKLGPQAFHNNTVNKIIRLLNCMNNHPTVMTHSKCTFWGKSAQNFTTCIKNRTHLLSECVANITNKRKFLEAVLHRGIYYVHIRKWLQTVPRERIFFTTMERLTSDIQIVLNEIQQFFKGSPLSLPSEQLKQLQRKCENSNYIKYKKSLLEMQNRTRSMLEKFFEPFNELLSELHEDTQYLWKH